MGENTDQSRPEIQPWEVVSRELVLDASPWVRHWTESVKLPDGRVIDDYHTVVLRDFASIVTFTPDNLLIIQKSYRHGVRRVSLGLPGGYLEVGEDSLTAAKRELLEETGYAAEDWHRICSLVVHGNAGCGTMHAFIARGAKRITDPDSGDLEDVHLSLMSIPEVMSALSGGEFRTLPSVTALLLALNGIRLGS